jgi:glycine cleavage system regulatory protein
VEVSFDKLESLRQDIQDLSDVSVILEGSGSEVTESRSLSYHLNIVGPDRNGILQEVTNQLLR